MCLYKNIILVSITILCTFQKTVAYIHTICKHCCEICVYVRVCVKILNKSSVNFVLLRHSEVKSFSRVRLFATPWTVAHQAHLSMEFSRQEYWNGLPFPSPGDLPDPGIEPTSPCLRTVGGVFATEPLIHNTYIFISCKNARRCLLKHLF